MDVTDGEDRHMAFVFGERYASLTLQRLEECYTPTSDRQRRCMSNVPGVVHSTNTRTPGLVAVTDEQYGR